MTEVYIKTPRATTCNYWNKETKILWLWSQRRGFVWCDAKSDVSWNCTYTVKWRFLYNCLMWRKFKFKNMKAVFFLLSRWISELLHTRHSLVNPHILFNTLHRSVFKINKTGCKVFVMSICEKLSHATCNILRFLDLSILYLENATSQRSLAF